MIVKVVTKQSDSIAWEDCTEIYGFDSSDLSRDSDPLDASSVANSESEHGLEIGVWQSWEKFKKCIEELELPASSAGLVDIPVVSFPDLGTGTVLIAPQEEAARMFLNAICDFVPVLEADLSRVFVRVD